MAVNNIPLVIGQRWKTRDGDEVEIVGYDEETNTEYVWDLSPEGSVTDEGYCLSVQCPSDYDLITLLKDAPAATAEIPDGFISWNGGECPVDNGVKIEYKMKNNPAKVFERFPDGLRWNHIGLGGDIIAYRVVQQEVKPTKVDVEEEQKYTIKQVFEAINRVTTCTVGIYEIDLVEEELAKTQDPEYNKYLELKAKFEKE